MFTKLSRRVRDKVEKKIEHLEHQHHNVPKLVIRVLNRTITAKERRERKQNRRQEAEELFQKKRETFIRIVNKRQIICEPPTGIVSKSNNSSISCQRSRSNKKWTTKFYSPAIRQHNADYLKQARTDLTKLKTFCERYALKNGYEEDGTAGEIIQTSQLESTVQNECDYKELIRLLKVGKSIKLRFETGNFVHLLAEWVRVDDENARQDWNTLPFNERQQREWSHIKKFQKRYWTMAEIDPSYAKQMCCKKATTLHVRQDSIVETLGSEMPTIDFFTKSLSTHCKHTPSETVVKDGFATESLQCSLPDSVSYASLRRMALKQGAWKRHGKLLNGAQMMMARDAFKPRRETFIHRSSGLRNEYRPHKEKMGIRRADSCGDLMHLS
ncbi:hypothetical protein E2P81_ATG09830 [Venturia nashicola]|uniref:Uncharacterized protein n=1 Tax=Venturia nashicola TaxID=86259 RepID=A0A4Z1NHC3_9PEZI|nr:hypothetical protein E6O75_ATG10050 [Venturia nashicola]TLD15350.1 hypothetical protein E2P81_ATG09830 [Venturia nashicola]